MRAQPLENAQPEDWKAIDPSLTNAIETFLSNHNRRSETPLLDQLSPLQAAHQLILIYEGRFLIADRQKAATFYIHLRNAFGLPALVSGAEFALPRPLHQEINIHLEQTGRSGLPTETTLEDAKRTLERYFTETILEGNSPQILLIKELLEKVQQESDIRTAKLIRSLRKNNNQLETSLRHKTSEAAELREKLKGFRAQTMGILDELTARGRSQENLPLDLARSRRNLSRNRKAPNNTPSTGDSPATDRSPFNDSADDASSTS